MRGIESRIAKLETIIDETEVFLSYREDRQGTGLFLKNGGDGTLMTRDQVTRDARGATAIVVIYQHKHPAFDVNACQVWMPDNGRGDSD